MAYKNLTHRKRRKEMCNILFLGFYPDFSKSRNKDELLLIYNLAKDGYFSHEIAERIGKNPKAIQKTFRRYDFPNLQNFAPPKLSERPNFVDGIKEMKGYFYKRMSEHPNGTKHGSYVAVHRLVMEKKINRYLTNKEVVHHIDGNPKNNHPDNLELFESNGKHLAVTLLGKCPNWSDEGLKRLDQSRRRPRKN